jgi:hypothetical protein
MSKMKNIATMYALAAMMGDNTMPHITINPKTGKEVPPIIPPIPKGCKQYFFNQDGEFSTEKMRKDECVFICIASNDKTAKKKFNKWQKTSL